MSPHVFLTLFEESLAVNYYPVALPKGSELLRKDGRQHMSKGMQLWGVWGLGTARKPLQLCATSSRLVLGP